MGQHKLVDNTILTINQASLSSVATLCTVSGDLVGISSILPVYAYVELEKIEITNVSGQDITIARGVGGTPQASHADTTEIRLNVVAENINELIDEKVDKIAGKDLSENDFSTTLKNKLDGIEANANSYTHPNAHSIADVTSLQSTLDAKVLKSTVTTKGDIFVRNGTVLTRLPVGSNGQVLISDSSTATGLAWGNIPQIFGSEFIEDTHSIYFSNPAEAFSLYKELAIPVVPVGKYRVAIYVVGQGTNVNSSYKAQMVVDGVSQGDLYEVEPKDGSTTQRAWFYGVAYLDFATITAHTIRIETATSNALYPADTYRSIIEFWRVS